MKADFFSEGEVLGGRFEIDRCLDESGRVALAFDSELDDSLVVKIVAGDEIEAWFRRIRKLRHPHLVPVFGLHRHGEMTFVGMEWIDGTTSGDLRAAALDRILPVALQVLEALEYSHQQGVVHRDVKASNVLLAAGGQAFLTDFGLAADWRSEGAPGEAPARQGGSRFSVSPQQLLGEPAQPADDLYGFGSWLYDLVSGRPPFWPEPSAEDILSQEPELANGPPESLIGLLRRLLDKKPEVRPSWAEVRATLRGCLDEVSAADSHRHSDGPRLRPPTRRNPKSKELVARSATEPPVELPARPLARRQSPWGARALVAGLMVATLAVVLWLPRWVQPEPDVPVEQQADPTGTVDEPSLASTDLPSADLSSADLSSTDLPMPAGEDNPAAQDPLAAAAERRQARGRLEALATSITELESQGVESWGGELWSQLQGQVEAAGSRFAERKWRQAASTGRQAEQTVAELQSRRRGLIDGALQAGDDALAAGRASVAEQKFQQVLVLEPGHGSARRGLARAQVWGQVQDLLVDAEVAEGQGRWTKAEDLYARALTLDGASRTARQGVERSRLQQRQDAFSQAMGQGYNALASGDGAVARRLFEAASAVPGADPRALKEAMAQVAEMEKAGELERLRESGRDLERQEQWQAAEKAYGQALELDPAVTFALDGRRRAARRAELQQAMDFHLSRPQRLSSAAVLTEAEGVLARAEEIDDGELHRRQTADLRRLVAQFSLPVSVELVSDQATEVWIFKVGKLGAFDRRLMELRPGTYTVTGSREGFRDVRKRWVIEPGKTPEPLDIRCLEAL